MELQKGTVLCNILVSVCGGALDDVAHFGVILMFGIVCLGFFKLYKWFI